MVTDGLEAEAFLVHEPRPDLNMADSTT